MSSYDFAMTGSFSDAVIPKFRELHGCLRSQVVAAGRKAGDFEFERLPHFLNAAYVSAMSLNGAARAVALKMAAPDGKAQRFVTGDAVALLYTSVESFLSATVKAQNGFIPYIRQTQDGLRSLPSSFKDLVAAVRKPNSHWNRGYTRQYFNTGTSTAKDCETIATSRNIFA